MRLGGGGGYEGDEYLLIKIFLKSQNRSHDCALNHLMHTYKCALSG